ncbi:hypothetical protein [Lactiplantibacillus paraxiangfangensis]
MVYYLTDEQLYNILKQSLTSQQLDSVQAAKLMLAYQSVWESQ